jgi:predicted ABC-type ATPase
MTSAQGPICRIIAGPNGAGKTTFALTYLRQFPEAQSFVNADLIAAGLSPLAPQQQLLAASRLMLKEIDNHIQARRSFAFETTHSGRGYLQLIRRLRSSGWRVELVYLALPSVELSILRVAERVAHGGHDVPLPVLRRRFPRSLQLLFGAYAPAVDHALCNLNAGSRPAPVFFQAGPQRTIADPTLYAQLLDLAR